MTTIQQIDREIKRRKDLNVIKVCKLAGVNSQTYYNALNSGNMKESTLSRLSSVIDKRIVLIDKDI